MTPLNAILVFLFAVLLVGAAAILVGGAQRRAEATATQATQEARERRMQSLLSALQGDPTRESVRQITVTGDYLNATLKNGATKEELATSLEIAKLCKEGRLGLPSCGNLTWGPGPDTLRAMAEVERAKAPHYHLCAPAGQANNGHPPPSPPPKGQGLFGDPQGSADILS